MSVQPGSVILGWLLAKPVTQRILVVISLIGGALVAVWWCIKHPKYSIPPTFAICAGIYWTSWDVLIWTLVLGYAAVIGVAGWLLLRYSEIDTWRELLYGLPRLWRVWRGWAGVCLKQGLVAKNGSEIPGIGRLRLSTSGVIAEIDTSPIGKHASVLKKYEFDIAASYQADRVIFRRDRNWLATFRIDWGAHLRKIYALHEVPESSQSVVWPYMIPFSISESGGAGELIANEPILVGGVTGSGKSMLAWAILSGYIKLGVPIKVDVIDPKGEFTAMRAHVGKGLVNSYTGGDATPEDYDKALARFYSAMKTRIAAMGTNSLHIPTVKEPFRLLIIDEGLPLAKSLQQQGVSHPLVMIASQGRAAGYIPLFLTQAAQKDVLGLFRDLTSNRISMRTASRFLTEVVLGEGCEGNGARCSDLDAEHDKGVGYQVHCGGYAAFRGPKISDSEAAIIATGRLPDPPAAVADHEDAPHIIYRLLGADEELLYIGITWLYGGTPLEHVDLYSEEELARRAAKNRAQQHVEKQPWGGDIKHVVVDHIRDVYPTKQVARQAEELAIRTEHPPRNVQHNRRTGRGVGRYMSRAKELIRDKS